MEISILGFKMRVVVILIGLVIGAILGCSLLCSCSRISMKEGMAMLGSVVDYKMGEGVHGSWDTRPQKEGPAVSWREQAHDSYGSNHVGPDKSLSFL